MAITPDTKDWTWVLERPCPECAFAAPAVLPAAVVPTLEEAATVWSGVLAREDVRSRPAPDVWSALEYGCHVRDVCRVMTVRAELMLGEDAPTFPNWDQDATAVTERYAEQDPGVVREELAAAAAAAAAVFGAVDDGAWDRTGYRSNGSTFTVLTLARYFLHDVVHHLHDVGA